MNLVIIQHATLDSCANLLNDPGRAERSEAGALGEWLVIRPSVQEAGRIGVAGAG